MTDKNKAEKTKSTQHPANNQGTRNLKETGNIMSAGNIDNVREILFGAQAQQYEQRFNRLEEILKNELANIRDETKKSLNSLESFVKKEFESLADELHTEKRERDGNIDDISESLKSVSKNLEKKIAALDDKNIRVQRDVQEQILKQSNDLMDDSRTKHENISSTLNDAVKELTDKKADRITLANLLTEMSMRLKEEFSLPEF